MLNFHEIGFQQRKNKILLCEEKRKQKFAGKINKTVFSFILCENLKIKINKRIMKRI